MTPEQRAAKVQSMLTFSYRARGDDIEIIARALRAERNAALTAVYKRVQSLDGMSSFSRVPLLNYIRSLRARAPRARRKP